METIYGILLGITAMLVLENHDKKSVDIEDNDPFDY